MKKKYSFIDPKDLVPGTIYGTRPDDKCSKYLYLEHIFKESREIKIENRIIHQEYDWHYSFMKWFKFYDLILHRSHGWNQIFHDLIDLTGTRCSRERWNHNLHIQDDENSEWHIRFNRPIKILFDPYDVKSETIYGEWKEAKAERNELELPFTLLDHADAPDTENTVKVLFREVYSIHSMT